MASWLCLSTIPLQAQTTKPADGLSQIGRTELARRADTAIAKGVKFLLSRQNVDGSWGAGNNTDTEGGNTALVTLALLSCGESYQSPPLQKAIAFLKRAQPDKALHATYSVSLRACVYAQLPEVLRKKELPADLQWLQSAMIARRDRAGMFDYGTGMGLGGDYSNSQYGVLGVWYGALAGIEVPRTFWKRAEDGWLNGVNNDGGWGYMPDDKESYASMTVAGAATLFITNDYLHAREYEDLIKPANNAPLDKAIKWLGDNFAADVNAGKDTKLGDPRKEPDADALNVLGQMINNAAGTYVHYMLFGYERVGEASGLTRFGTHKWFEQGAEFLIRTQAYDGSWTGTIGSEPDTSYSLLFLSRGRAPIVIQKLQFDGRWNNRPRDAASFTYFMRRASERHVNWQIVSATEGTPAEFRESPLLYIASDRAPRFSREALERLKTYIEQGGLVVCANEGRTVEFADGITKTFETMFPEYKFRELPPDHLAYTANFPVNAPPVKLRGLSNGIRELVVLYPAMDMSWKWQSTGGGFLPKASPYASLANLLLYATDRANPRLKGEDAWVERNDATTPSKTISVARLKYDGNWNPEPAALVRLSNILHNFDNLELKIEVGDLSLAIPDRCYLAYLAAADAIKLTDEQKKSIRAYTDAGGLVVFEAAGGSTAAGSSLEDLIGEIYPGASVEPLPLDHPIYHAREFGGQDIDEVKYRRSENFESVHIPRLRGITLNGKLVGILSREDLSGGLVGYSTAGLRGYTSASATDIMRNLMLWRAKS